MNEPDLRPEPGRKRRPDREPVRVGGARWWEPLASKWGVLGLFVFIGLVWGFAEDSIKAIRGQGETQRPSAQATRQQNQDAATLQKRLLDALSELTGADPVKNREAERLAQDYWSRRSKEDSEKRAKEEKDPSRNAAVKGPYNPKYVFYNSNEGIKSTPSADLLQRVKSNMPEWSGETTFHQVRSYIELLEARDRSTRAMATKKQEIESLIWAYKSVDPHESFKNGGEIMQAIEEYYRLADSGPPLATEEEINKAKMRIRKIPTMSYDDGAALLIQELGKAYSGDARYAWGRLRNRLQ